MAAECLKELVRVEKLLSFASDAPAASLKANSSGKKAATPSIASSLDSLLDSLHEFKHGIEAGATSAEAVEAIGRVVEGRKKDMDEKQREVYNALSKLGKALDKVQPEAPNHVNLAVDARGMLAAVPSTITRLATDV